MLERLERSYLGLLRVFILVLATCALIGAGAALVMAVTEKVRSTRAESLPTTGGDLAGFIQEQKDVSRAEKDAGVSDTGAENTDPIVLPDIRAAAKNLVAYRGKNAEFRYAEMAKLLQDKSDTFGIDGPAYAADLKALTEQLKASRGKKLSLNRLAGLIDWHLANFKLSIETRDREQAEARANLQLAVQAAAAAVITFLLTIFVFIFVKIERNLRFVRMSPVDAGQVDHA